MWKSLRHKGFNSLFSSEHIAPLVTLRIIFGALMLFSTLRFFWKGWIESLYITPQFHFTFYGFDWVKPLGEVGMYGIFALMAVSSLCILLGLFYRISALLFFVSFTYVELIDKTYYLNHYYFVCLIAFLMLLVPANRYFSIDAIRDPKIKATRVPAWTISIFKFQLLLVYLFAGISKITPDWLLQAMPLKIWLPANAHLPVIGPLLTQEWVAYVFSWFGMFFDLTVVFFLLNTKIRPIAYIFVVLFHIFTAWFFKIGMFPFIMIGITLIFFSENFHQSLIQKLQSLFKRSAEKEEDSSYLIKPVQKEMIYSVLVIYFLLQLIIPFRYLLYPGKLLWTEEGYRFSWRVMLMEKSGTTFFYVKDPHTGNSSEVNTREFLTPFQEKMMSTQPDMILQFAHHLEKEYKKRGVENPIVTTDAYITLNGSGSRLMIDNTVDLTKEEDNLSFKKWILSYQKNKSEK